MRYFLAALLLTGCGWHFQYIPSNEPDIEMIALPGTDWLFIDNDGHFRQCNGVVEVKRYPQTWYRVDEEITKSKLHGEFYCTGKWSPTKFSSSIDVNNSIIYTGDDE